MQAVILSERVLADTDRLFAASVAHIARKLGRVKPLDAGALPAGRAQTVAALDAWAGAEVGTWRGELGRFYEDHVPVHLRPDPALNAALRRLSAAGLALACWSPGPAEAAEVVLHHLGIARLLATTAVGDPVENVLRLADELATSRAEALLVADDADVLQAASDAGLATAAALWTGRLDVASAPAPAAGTPADLVALALTPVVAT